MRPSFSLGIEEEYQTIDPETRDMQSHVARGMLEQGQQLLHDQVKPEMHQSVVEVGTGICCDIQAARRDLTELRQQMIALARKNGLQLAAAGTHPFAEWRDQEIYPAKRYETIVEDLQVVARGNLVFGLHVHVGIEDRDTMIHVMNGARYFLPHLLALSASSPFWRGIETGLKSYRSEVFGKFPRTSLPSHFESWAEFERFVGVLVKTNCIDNGKKIWWDLRPHPTFPTLEFRVCDLPMRLDETIALAALIQATVAKLYKLHAANQSYRLHRRALLMENKWRAARYGLEGKLIDFGKEEEVAEHDLILEYLEFVDDVLDELGSRDEVAYVRTMLREGSGADRQLRVFRETGDLTRVVDYIVEETAAGLNHATA